LIVYKSTPLKIPLRDYREHIENQYVLNGTYANKGFKKCVVVKAYL